MNIVLCSAFRNSTGYIGRYCTQAHNLYRALNKRGDSLNLILGEGDSADDTRADLVTFFTNAHATIVDCTHGGAIHGSVVDTERFRQLAHVGRRIWAAIPADADAVVYVEADLIWAPKTILALIDHLETYPAISPMIMLDRAGWEGQFYDTWAARKDGVHFVHQYPFHACYNPEQPFMVDSMGSCMAMRGDIARRLVIDEQVFVGMCAQIYALGESVWLDPNGIVLHS